MTAKTPIRTVFDGSNNATGLAEFQTGEFIAVEFGGTGAVTHTANAILTGNGTSAVQSSSLLISGTSISTSDSTQIQINEGVDISGALSVGGNATITGNLTVQGSTTTINASTIDVQNAFRFEGSTSDDFETILTVTDPTADRTITLPNATGTIVLKDTTDTLTNKSIDLGNNTLTGSLSEFNSALQSDSFVSLTGSETLTNKTLTSAVLNTGVSGTAVLDEDDMTSNSNTQLATQQSIKAYVDAQVTASDLDFQGDSGGALSIDLDSETFTIAGGTAITTSGSGNTVTVTLDNTAVSAGSYGSATAIPTFTVDAQGRLTAAGTANVATDLTIVDDSSTSATISLLTDTLKIAGDTGITTAITGDTVSIDLNDTAVTPGSYGSSTAIPTFTVDQQGRLTAASTTAISSDMSIAGDSGTDTITVGTDTFTIAGGTGLSSTATTDTITLNIDSTVTTLTGTQTLTNKTLTSPTITGTGAIAGTFTGDITGDVTGNADTATTLATARTIAGQSFDGSANITIASTDLSNTSDVVLLTSTQTLTNKTLTSPTITGTGAIAGTFTGNITGDVTGNADTATTLATARTIAGQSFDGSANITIAATDLSDTNQSLSTSDNVSFANLTLSGNLTVNGATTTVSSTNTTITDNLIELNSGAGSNANDTGILIERGSTGDNAIIAWDESADKFTVGTTTATASSTGNLTITTGTLVANVEGNITGDVTGNADTATTLATARTIAGQSFDGSANITIASTDLSNTSDIVLLTSTQTLTNKTLTSPTITGTGAIAGTFTGNITGDVTGNADTATTLATARTIAGQSFDGSANITIASTDLSNTSAIVLLTSTQTLTNKTLTSPTITGTGAIAGTFTGNITGDVTGNADTATTLATARTIGGVSFNGSANINLPGVNTSGNQDTSGNAATATALETARTIAGKSFDGTGNITIASTDLSNTSAIALLTSTQTLTNKTISGSSNTLSNIGNSSLTNSSITINGSSVSLGGSATISAGTDWQAVKTSAFTAVAGEGYFVNTTSAAITVTLPSSPSIGDEVRIVDYAGTADTNNITVARNGKNIMGSAADMTVSTERASIGLVYVDTTQGWLLTENI
jgi:hypothetical protein